MTCREIRVGQRVRCKEGGNGLAEDHVYIVNDVAIEDRTLRVKDLPENWSWYPWDWFETVEPEGQVMVPESEKFVKHDAGKPRPDLVPATALQEVWKVLSYGAAKYDDDNWRKTKSIRRYFSATLRHLWAWFAGEDLDEESGLHHLGHAATCVLFMLSLAIDHPYCDDRP